MGRECGRFRTILGLMLFNAFTRYRVVIARLFTRNSLPMVGNFLVRLENVGFCKGKTGSLRRNLRQDHNNNNQAERYPHEAELVSKYFSCFLVKRISILTTL